MKKTHGKGESNDPIYFSILAVFFLMLGAATFLHDPILHGLFAYANGWEVTDYETGLMVGSTFSISPTKRQHNVSVVILHVPSINDILNYYCHYYTET